MFKIEKTGKNAFKYLTDCENQHLGLNNQIFAKYLEADNKHFKAILSGGMADDMGLEYSTDVFKSLMSGECPEALRNKVQYNLKNGKNFVNVKGDYQAGTDLLSAPPKSVSMEFALSDYEGKKKIIEAMRETDLEIQKFIAKKVKPSCDKGEYQDFDPSKTKIMVATFTHYEDRQIDPHIHNHGVLMNFAEFTFNRVNEKGEMVEVKKVLALDTEDLFKTQLEMSSMYDTILNGRLRDKGYKTEYAQTAEGHQTFRLCGFTEAQEKGVSKRGDEIKEFIEQQKKKGKHFANMTMAEAEYKKLAQSQTREEKKELSTEEIWKTIRDETEKVMTKDEISNKNKVQKLGVNQIEKFDMNAFLERNIFNTNTYVSETELRKELSNALRFCGNHTSFVGLEKEINKQIERMKDPRNLGINALVEVDGAFTKLSTYQNEKKSLENLLLLSSKNSNDEQSKAQEQRNLLLLDKFKSESKFELNAGQEDACALVAKNNGLTVIVGDAGTGKTTSVIKFSAEMNKANGVNVFGLSTQTTTAEALEEAGIDKNNCLNTKLFLTKCYDKTGRFNREFIERNQNSVFIIDEAGMVGAEDYKKITDVVVATNSKLIIVGDQKQLSSVSYGHTFEQIQEELDKSFISRLDINTRQKEGASKEIAEAYRDKNIDKVFELLDRENCLITEKTSKKTIERLVNDYFEDKDSSKIIICGTNQEIDAVNGICRERVISEEIEKSKLDKKYKSSYDFKNQYEITVSRPTANGSRKKDLMFCAGDEVVFLKNMKGSVNNGQTGKITSIKKNNSGFDVVANVDGKEVKFNTNEYSYFNHSFALSSHKSQGKTYNNTYHLGSSKTTSNKSYVDGSRHKNQYKLYIDEKSVENFKKNAVKSSRKVTTIGNKTVEDAYAVYLKSIKTSPSSNQHLISGIIKGNTEKYANSMSNKPLPSDMEILERYERIQRQKRIDEEAKQREIELKRKLAELDRIEQNRRNQQNAMVLQRSPSPYANSPRPSRGMSR